MKFIITIFTLSGLLLFNSCSEKSDELTKVTINEIYQTERNELDNVDSPSFWKGNDQNWLISTAKSTDRLLVHDASSGKLLKNIGKSGSGELEFKRPNGIAVIDSFAFVVERDNKRIQVLSLPNFKFITFIAENDLIKPYGIYINKESNIYNIYITDNYETADENIPADSLLDKRVLHYTLSPESKVELVKKFGSTSGDGTLRIVESIFGDPFYDNLLIAEEKEDETCVKVYDLEGNYKDLNFGRNLFKYQVEGIALYEMDDSSGFWIVTDQDSLNNTFHVFNRSDFVHLGYFQGNNTINTDGIWLTQEAFKDFPGGAFFAVHNDGNVSCFKLDEIINNFNNKN